jgi:ferrous-iron efflux pump FieF
MRATTSRSERERLLRWATNASVLTALTLGLCKLVAFWLSGSVAVLASLVDSALDGSASILNALAVRYAMKPADDDHRFGHGKSEALAGLAQALLIGTSGGFIIRHAIDRLLHPEPLQAVGVSLLVMSVSLAATIALVVFQSHVVKKTESMAVKADALHYMSDIGANLATILAVAVAPFGYSRLDPVFGIVIALITLYSAVRIGWETFHVLMDRELPAEAQQRIRGIVLAHDKARGLHDLRTRRSGPNTLIQFHLELDGDMSLNEANHIAHEVSNALTSEFPGADVLVHQDPSGPRRAGADFELAGAERRH